MKGGVSKTRGQSDVGLVVQSSQLDVTAGARQWALASVDRPKHSETRFFF